MKLTNRNQQKIFITRARLWANVYHSMLSAGKELAPIEQSRRSAKTADEAIAFFDQRFNQPPKNEETSQRPDR